jgi:hypothetical protein
VDNLNTARAYLGAGAGTQTAALAFGRCYSRKLLQAMQQKNIMVQLGLQAVNPVGNTARFNLTGCRNTNSSISIFGG